MSDDPKILCVAPAYPWPPIDGYRTRLANMVLALAEVGTVDFVWLADDSQPEPAAAPTDRVRLIRLERDPERPRRQWMGEWLRSDLPRPALFGRYRSARAEAPARIDPSYDLVYHSNLDTWIDFRGVATGPELVDFDNLQSALLRGRRHQRPDIDAEAGAADRAKVMGRWMASRALDVVDERRWDRWQKRCASEVAAVTLCSDLDVTRSKCANAVAIPNGYELEWSPRPARSVASAAPVISFVGLLSYEPNADAVRWFATEILPRLRRQIPQARFRVVGRGGEGLADLAGRPGLELVGQVRDLRTELDRADLSVVPIRFGGGTRLKVTEALANRIPTVTTTVGCEGIDVVDGTHALIADTADDFVRACGRALSDVELRRRLAAEGSKLYEERYRWTIIRARMADLARAVIAGRGPTV